MERLKFFVKKNNELGSLKLIEQGSNLFTRNSNENIEYGRTQTLS